MSAAATVAAVGMFVMHAYGMFIKVLTIMKERDWPAHQLPWKIRGMRGLTDDADSRTDGILGDHGRRCERALLCFGRRIGEIAGRRLPKLGEREIYEKCSGRNKLLDLSTFCAPAE